MFEKDYFWRRTPNFREFHEVIIRRDQRESARGGVPPNLFIGGVPDELRFKDVDRAWKKLREPDRREWRKICVEEQFQRVVF